MSKPTSMHARIDGHTITASVLPDGADWHVRILTPAGDRINRYVSTHSQRPDNGALSVAALLRREFGLNGTYQLTSEVTQ